MSKGLNSFFHSRGAAGMNSTAGSPFETVQDAFAELQTALISTYYPDGDELVKSLQLSQLLNDRLHAGPKLHTRDGVMGLLNECQLDLKRQLVCERDTAHFRAVSTMLQPVVRALNDVLRRAASYHKEQLNSKRIQKMKSEVLRLCDLLSLDPISYVSFSDATDFEQHSKYLQSQAESLQKLASKQKAAIKQRIEEINTFREELGEDTVPHLPEHGEEAGVMLDIGASALQRYDELLAEVKAKRDSRVSTVRHLATDILSLWKEDSQLPSIHNPNLSDVDKKLLTLLKNAHNRVENIVGVNAEVLHQLAEKKQELVVAKEDRIRTTMEMGRRLRLIEDRQYLLAKMKEMEASARNPLRLFGKSEVLLEEERFRRSAYPRLLLIEAVLRPSLMLYKERHGRPFLYQGVDYLETLDAELLSRVVPRDVFPTLHRGRINKPEVDRAHAARAETSLNGESDGASPLELLFGESLHDDVLAGVEEKLATVIEEHVADFARVVQLSTRVTNVLAERVMNIGVGGDGDSSGEQVVTNDDNWAKQGSQTYDQREAESEALRLRELGWRLPPERPGQGPSKKVQQHGAGASAREKKTIPSKKVLQAPVPPPHDIERAPCSFRHNRGLTCDEARGGYTISANEIFEKQKRIRDKATPQWNADLEQEEEDAKVMILQRHHQGLAQQPTGAFSTPEAPLITKPRDLLPGNTRKVLYGDHKSRISLSSAQLDRMRSTQHTVRFDETDEARALRRERQRAYTARK